MGRARSVDHARERRRPGKASLASGAVLVGGAARTSDPPLVRRVQRRPSVPDAAPLADTGQSAACSVAHPYPSLPTFSDHYEGKNFAHHWREVEPPRCLGSSSVVDAKQLAALLSVAALVALVPARSAEAKFSITLALQPKRPIAGQPVRVVMRTGASLPKKHGLKLTAIGPWRTSFGQTFFDVRLVRLGPRQFTATVRFPYSGRWRLIVPNWGAPGSAYPPPVDLPVRVRPRG